MKKERAPESDEFYVGYLPYAPEKTSSFVRKSIIGIGIAIFIIVVLLAFNQKEFSSALFDYGTLTEQEGYLFKGPVPHLKVFLGNEDDKDVFQTILLVGFGKAGADKTILNFERSGGSLEGKRVRLGGYRIHGNGRVLLQLDENVPPVRLEKPGEAPLPTSLSSGKRVSLSGEIIDPKCYFGVMKPGEGKPHRSCAIRCIAGGIPPVFRTTDDDYVILLGDDLRPVNNQVLSMVGDQINLEGQLVQFDNWKILMLKRDNLMTLSKAARLTRNLLAMESGIAVCRHN